MRNLRRRIAELEKASSASRPRLPAILDATFMRLGFGNVEPLISAYGADRVGRPLTEREALAKEAFAEAVARECQSAGLQSTPGFEPTAYIPKAISIGLALRFTVEELRLAQSAMRASAGGYAPTESELAALQAGNAEQQRLWQLAGIGSVEEYKAFCSQAKSSEGGDLC